MELALKFAAQGRPPITAAELPPGWIADVRSAVQLEGWALRASTTGPIRIESKSLRTGEWMRLSPTFTTAAERDLVLEQLVGRDAVRACQVREAGGEAAA